MKGTLINVIDSKKEVLHYILELYDTFYLLMHRIILQMKSSLTYSGLLIGGRRQQFQRQGRRQKEGWGRHGQ